MKTDFHLSRNLAGGILAALLLAGCGRDPVSTGIKAIQNGDLQTAESILGKVLQEDPTQASALMNMAIIQFKLGQQDAAMTGFAKVADMVPDDPRPLEYIAAILADNNQWRDAADMLNEAARRDSHSLSVQTAQAVVDLNLSGAQTARARLLQIVAKDPGYAPALFNLAVLNRDWLKNQSEGKRYFQRYLAVAKNDSHITVARNALAEKAPSLTPKKTGTPPVPQPASPQTVAPPAIISTSVPAPVAQTRNPAEATTAFRQGVKLHTAGETDKAIQEYTRAIQNDPSMARAHYNLGLLLRTKGDLPRAQEAFTHALDNAPGMVDARYMLALVMIDQNNAEGATTHLKTVIEKVPRHADAHLALGMLYKKDATKAALAKKELSTYLELAPDSRSAREIKNWLKYQR